MTTGSLIIADLLIAVLAAAGWLGAGGAAAAGRSRVAPALAAGALLATLARAVTVIALARAGWWFAAEKVLIAGPLSLAAIAAAVAGLLRPRWPRATRTPAAPEAAPLPARGAGARETPLPAREPGVAEAPLPVGGAGALEAPFRVGRAAMLGTAPRPEGGAGASEAAPLPQRDAALPVPAGPRDIRSVAVALLFAGYAETAALLVTVLHGYPASVGVGLLAVAAVAAATAVTWRLVGPRPGAGVSRAILAVAGAALVAGVGLSVAPGAAPGVPHRHVYPVALAVGEPTKRFTLTAGTATVTVDGAAVRAWAFNGQVPGPELAVTVGDVVEVTLRNRDVGAGVTLHWHGYDVPNSQDGVPGVTQDAVLPGQEFVYRFRADQAGTYWYHTHEATSEGVRMGLYGAFVVRPAAAAGVDRVIAVHTLAGHPLPAAASDRVGAGSPVRLRLINTDNTTHRYAVAGAPFRVAAIDGVDLRGPTDLSGTAVAIPAGGRYDLTLTAPATPIALLVDGRPVYSTGAVTAATDTWPVLDPLAYGSPAPAPWAGADRAFTLVLDRGLDLRGLVPRYAHTVGGAAYPDIPNQVVGRGDTVKFTIVNRSLGVHPWHLHGFHVLVLSRNGTAARGSPLWLDSFDVRPGDVWEVTFRADSPGTWANHCHNLPHADAGMMLHLVVTG
ncbi:multicopper oxidase family protein [Actinoplanes sp. NPDC026619]|uniref:multicopper oxidase family protein n=1 Tax=Actinoplanes sp. NPDC026619 TaxID=3155798 RepID=UPI00340E1A86